MSMQHNWLFGLDGTRISRDPQLMRRYFLEHEGVLVLDGFPSEPRDAPYAQRQEGSLMVSFLNAGIGYKIDHSGSPLFEWYTETVPEDVGEKGAVFFFCFSYGTGVPYPQCSGWYDLMVNDKKVISFRAVKYDQIFVGNQGAKLALRVAKLVSAERDHAVYIDPDTGGDSWVASGSAALGLPRSLLTPGQPVKLKIVARSFFPSREWFRIEMLGRPWHGRLFGEMNVEKTLRLLDSGRTIPFLEGTNVYFGDIHAHSDCGKDAACGHDFHEFFNRDCFSCHLEAGGNGCGYGTLAHNYYYARYISNLDFFCLADHDFQIYGNEDWWMRTNIAQQLSEQGRFVAIPGYEFTSFAIGHRNVYFGTYDNTIMISSKSSPENRLQESAEGLNPRLLWERLAQAKSPFLTVPHHPPVICHAFNWDTFNPEYDRLVEVFSGWGDHWYAEGFLRGDGSDKEPDLSVRRAFENGLFFGMVASSDSHDGCPGSAQGSGRYNWANKFSRVGSGLAALEAETLDLDGIYHALYGRRCYATTGVHAVIRFMANDAPMGSDIITRNGDVRLKLSVRSPLEVLRIRIYRGRKLLGRIFCDEREEGIELVDHLEPGERAQYVAIVDFRTYERAWSSPIRVSRE